LLLLGGAFTLECALGPRNEAFDVTGTVITGEDPAQVILYAKGRATASTG